MAPKSKSSASTLVQSKLSFGASKGRATANKAKAVSAESSQASSTSKRPTRAAAKKHSVADLESSDEEQNVDDIELPESEPSSDSEIEEDEEEKRGLEGKNVTRSRETSASKIKAKVEEAAPQPKVLGVPAESKPVKNDVTTVEKELEELADSRPTLNVNNRVYDKIHKETKEKMGKLEAIHPTTEVNGKDVPLNRVDNILRVFDMTYEYGPCVGMTRLERWNRANKLGLHPPAEVYDILMTKEGLKETRYAQNVLHVRV